MSFSESGGANNNLTNIAERLAGWLPIRVRWQRNNPLFDWCFLGTRRFTESFFDDTIEAELRRPFNLLMRPLTGIDVLERSYALRPVLPPTGFIFHLSRCGSTLISQMLAALPQNVVISEAPPLDWMIRVQTRRPEITGAERISWIRWMVAALGQKRSAAAENYFIKFDSRNTLELDVLTRAFPDTPWIFLYRRPLEIMVSHDKQRGGGTIPGVIGSELPGMTLADSLRLSPEEYVARILAAVGEAALAFRDRPNALFVNYDQLPQFVTSTLLKHFRVDYSAEDIEIMNSAARFDAKSPQVEFAGDSRRKQSEASDTMRMISDKMLMPLYERLEAARRR